MEEIKQVPNGADIELLVEVPTIDGTPYDIENGEWEIILWVFSNKGVKVKHSADGGSESLGDIHADAVPDNDKGISLYIKSSEVPFGKGDIKGQMTIFAPNDNFKEATQVIKTFECEIGVRIV